MQDPSTMTGRGTPVTAIDHLYKESLNIYPGDFVWIDSTDLNKVKPFSQYTWNTNIATTMGTLNAVFVGIASETRFSADTTAKYGPVYDVGECARPCAALGADVPPGTLVTGTKNSGGNTVDNRIVATTTDITTAIGRTSKWAFANDTTLVFRLSTLTGIPVQAPQ